jgi:hypothetical protein
VEENTAKAKDTALLAGPSEVKAQQIVAR